MTSAQLRAPSLTVRLYSSEQGKSKTLGLDLRIVSNEIFCANCNLVPRVRVTLDQRSGTRDSGIKRLPENKNPVIGQTAQASSIRTSGFTKCSHQGGLAARPGPSLHDRPSKEIWPSRTAY